MHLENKNETFESPVLERRNEQTSGREVAEDANKFLEGIKTDSISALAEFSEQIKKDTGIVNPNTENGRDTLAKLDTLKEEQKQIEKEFVDDIVLWHGSGFSTITLENLSIDRISDEMKEFLEDNGKASADIRSFGFYTADSLEKIRYLEISEFHKKKEEEKLKKELEDKKVYDIENQANALSYYMFTKKVSYKEAISIYEQEIEEPVNQFFKEKEYSLEELPTIALENHFNDFDSLLKKRLEKYKPTAYKLDIDKNAKMGNPKDIPGFKSDIIKISEEDYKRARELGYDVLVGSGEYVILNKDVVKKIDKSIRTEIREVDKNTGEEVIKKIFPEFDNEQ